MQQPHLCAAPACWCPFEPQSPLVERGGQQLPRLGSCPSPTGHGAENAPAKMMGKSGLMATSCLQKTSASLVNCVHLIYCEKIVTSLHFFLSRLFFSVYTFIFFPPNGSFGTPVLDASVKCLTSQGRELEHQSASVVFCRELSSDILSAEAGKGQYHPKCSPRMRGEEKMSSTAL